MKSINIYINEALKLGKSRYKYCPKTKKELQELLRQLIENAVMMAILMILIHLK